MGVSYAMNLGFAIWIWQGSGVVHEGESCVSVHASARSLSLLIPLPPTPAVNHLVFKIKKLLSWE